ncbi:hypothetical protein [Thalassomonas actiniarum]|uniref:C-type lysozyme inhibitor domain-containing protein n=1 Tax=Thalassomonas actiniarum TaxID=485447 RepID=A0AAE9YME1_9GAMM|nr:hypothetical protein [Thalassomonas actiniarum]WDD96914.1 hypothetical protein SG35_016275 [Thalassomonas actiniarum]
MKLLSLIFLTISFSVLAIMPDRVNVITPKVAVCNGFEITYKDNETLVLNYPKTINKRWLASSVTIDYQINGEGAFVSRVPYNQLDDKPYVWIGFHNGFKQNHDARIDISYSCTDCELEKSEFYSIESIKKFSELSEFSKNEFVCNKSS